MSYILFNKQCMGFVKLCVVDPSLSLMQEELQHKYSTAGSTIHVHCVHVHCVHVHVHVEVHILVCMHMYQPFVVPRPSRRGLRT
jgi:hypothetical protein